MEKIKRGLNAEPELTALGEKEKPPIGGQKIKQGQENSKI